MAASSTIPYAHVAAGHKGISTTEDGSLLIKPCTQAEIDFYESAESHELFKAHMPIYMGSLILSTDPTIQGLAGQLEQNAGAAPPSAISMNALPVNGASNRDVAAEPSAPPSWKPSGGAALTTGLAIVLSNITAGFTCPNVIDLKLGARLWDDDAPSAKRQKLDQVSTETTSSSLGFRVAGMRIYTGDHEASREVNTDVTQEGYKVYNKAYGRALTEQNVKSAFETYLASAVRRGKGSFIAKRILRELESIQFVLEEEESRMYSASILIVYEGNEAALEQSIQVAQQEDTKTESEEFETDGNNDSGEDDDMDDELEDKNKIHDVRLIDFAHAHWTPGEGADENALQGVRSVVRLFKEIVLTNA